MGRPRDQRTAGGGVLLPQGLKHAEPALPAGLPAHQPTGYPSPRPWRGLLVCLRKRWIAAAHGFAPRAWDTERVGFHDTQSHHLGRRFSSPGVLVK